MQNHTEIGDDLLEEVVARRWMRLQHRNWPSAEAQTGELNARGVSVDARTVRGWRNGALPQNRHLIALVAAGFGALVERSMAPAFDVGRVAELEAEIEDRKARVRAEEDELHRLKAAAATRRIISDQRDRRRRKNRG